MGLRGPAPKDKELRLISVKAGVPAAPSWLDEIALEEYNRIVEIVLAAGESIALVDMAVLASYAQAYSDVVRLTEAVRVEGETLMNDKGTTYQNPRWAVLQAARNQLLSCASKLGFSPSDRSRITLPANTKKPNNPFTNLLGDGEE